jgi:hypothetical protein
MLSLYRDADATANIEDTFHSAPMRGERCYEIIKDFIRDMLMEYAFIAIGPDVQLEGFGFKDFLIRYVLNYDRGEVRLPRGRAHTGELIRLEPNHVMPIWVPVGECLELLAGLGVFSEQSKTF